MINYCKSAGTGTDWKEAISEVARDYLLPAKRNKSDASKKKQDHWTFYQLYTSPK